MTYLRTAIPRFSLSSFQPFVLFYQLIQFIPVFTQVLVIPAHVHFVKSGHHESGVYFRMEVPYMGLQDIVWRHVFTQGAFHTGRFRRWLRMYNPNAFFVLPARAAISGLHQLSKSLGVLGDQVFFKSDG
jgi:hypothetical protein